MKTVAARVAGKVQGVGFRAFVLQEARRRGLAGEVWNSQDGSVGCIIQGEGDAVDALLNALWSGPGRVDSVEPTDLAAQRAYDEFRVTQPR